MNEHRPSTTTDQDDQYKNARAPAAPCTSSFVRRGASFDQFSADVPARTVVSSGVLLGPILAVLSVNPSLRDVRYHERGGIIAIRDTPHE